jgi:hypothetical protein
MLAMLSSKLTACLVASPKPTAIGAASAVICKPMQIKLAAGWLSALSKPHSAEAESFNGNVPYNDATSIHQSCTCFLITVIRKRLSLSGRNNAHCEVF